MTRRWPIAWPSLAELLHNAPAPSGLWQERAANSEDLIQEKYRGIRPHPLSRSARNTEKPAIFDLLQAAATGITLTESFAMYPASSVSGLTLPTKTRIIRRQFDGKDRRGLRCAQRDESC